MKQYRFLTTIAGILIVSSQVSHGMEPSPSSQEQRPASATAAGQSAPPPPAPSRIRVKYREGQQSTVMTFDANALVSLHGTANIQNRLALPGRNAEDIILDRAVSEQELARIADTIARSPAVEYAVPEKIERIQQVNDPRYAEQWDYFKAATGIRLPQAWNHSGGKNVVVAVLDTGVRKHADLIGRLLDGYDMVEDLTRSNDGNGRDPDPTDPGDWCPSEFDSKSSWHGTHVADSDLFR
ncbi:S8 family serine peptidase, partial [Bradyrhizobium liaoningense]|uniref:S8 family serine peptidase n=1 Tax=Bradyrhizobium liaoningense TaxID=43992 RepID=UPI0012FE01A2